ncbi:MAG: hypothetical protein RL169_2128 [Armatimonadota bacterium]
MPSAGTAIPVPSHVVLTLVTDTTRDRPVRLEEDGVFMMSANAWRRGLSGIKAKLSATLQTGGRVRCDDNIACEWLGQNVDAAGPDDADVVVASAQYWPDEATPDVSDVALSTGEMRIVIPLISSRKHGLIGGEISSAGAPINLTSGSTRRDYLLASNDMEDLVLGVLSKKTHQVRQITGPAKRRADQLAVDLEYADANSVFFSVLKYGSLVCVIFALFGRAFPLRLLLLTLSGVLIAAASSTLAITVTPNVTGYMLGTILGFVFCVIGWKFAPQNGIGLLGGCLLADLLTGGYLGSYAGLGANPVVGARYYGVGNELSALLIGAVLALQITNLSQRVIAIGIAALLIGHPGLGANGGDMVAILIGIIGFSVLHGGKSANLIAAGVITAVTAVVVWDAYLVPSSMQSHIGRLVASAGSGVFELLASKASAHIRLMSTSAWGVTALISLVWWVIRYRHRQGKKPDLGECLALPLFLLNDSGPVSITLFTLVAMSWDNTVAPKNAWSWITKHAGALRHK